ncbi:peptidoglycan D,D-transpeptidase FtsI family protein [Yunchengibacter salinarum]|uniref:peptidoglycan D,D-transpeptidase FtsI family protein n=1 Tax=Yunchengibacter salinarum TaxID=3133399 RepID=UPI0035B636BC
MTAYRTTRPLLPMRRTQPDAAADVARLPSAQSPATLEVARSRLTLAAVLFLAGFALLAMRAVDLGMAGGAPRTVSAPRYSEPVVEPRRGDIVDRNGEVLATSLTTDSLYADASRIKNPDAVARALVSVLPELNVHRIRTKLASNKRFVWLHRKLTPDEKWQVNALGVPGLKFRQEEDRVYPHGRLAAHVLGHVDVDGKGLAGIEHYFDDRLSGVGRGDGALRLSIDARVQYAMTDELATVMRAHRAKGAAGVMMDVHTGEVLAMVSLPDFDPNDLDGVSREARFNRASKGVYELGSTFKSFTFAAALDHGVADLSDGYDATRPLRVARFTIRDDHPKARYLSLPEIFAYSSNIGTAQLALDLGTERQRQFLGKLGLLDPVNLELTEVGAPMVPARWRRVSTMTVSYGHGIAVSPVNLTSAVAALVNGGRRIPATLVRQEERWKPGRRVISDRTSRTMRTLMRLAVVKGTGSKAEAVGYRVGGKTGTAEKASGGGYAEGALISSFVGAFPMDDPRYVVFALLDEPKGTDATFGFKGGGWTAAPVVRNVILRTAPLLGVNPRPKGGGLLQRVAHLMPEPVDGNGQ